MASYLTRLSDVKYSSTTIGLYFLVLYFGAKVIDLMSKGLSEQTIVFLLAILALISGFAFIFGKKEILKRANGLD